MHSLQIIAGLDLRDGGPSHTLPELWDALLHREIGVHVCTTGSTTHLPPLPKHPFFHFASTPRSFPQFLKYSQEFLHTVEHHLQDANLIHNHGCWLYPNWVAGRLARKNRIPLVISPLGHLDTWSLNHHAWRKRFIRYLVEDRIFQSASGWIAKSRKEADQLRRLGFRQPIAIIPNGICKEHYLTPASSEPFLDRFPKLRNRQRVLFLSRLHPKKGLPLLLHSWEKVIQKCPSATLVIAGNHNHVHGWEYMDWCQKNLPEESYFFTGELNGILKRSAFIASILSVLPSQSENFGQTVLESLASGIPVITTQNCPWSELVDHDCGWWLTSNHHEWAITLTRALQLDSTHLQSMGQRGQKWVLQNFDWNKIAVKMQNFYQEIIRLHASAPS